MKSAINQEFEVKTLTVTGSIPLSAAKKITVIILSTNWTSWSFPKKQRNISSMKNTGGTQLARIRGSLPNRAISITIRTPLPNGIGERKTRYPKNTAL